MSLRDLGVTVVPKVGWFLIFLSILGVDVPIKPYIQLI